MSDAVEVLRKKHRKQRKLIADDELSEHALQLEALVAVQPEYQMATHIAAYIAILGEISVEPLIRSGAANGKTFYLPVLRGESMVFAPWQPDQPLVKKAFGLLEPDCDESEWISPMLLDVVLTPLVVFDHHCNRIGQGGGFYDRTFEFILSAGKPFLMGVAHESQREPELVPQSWDIPLHKIVTERSVYCRPEVD